MTPPIQQPIPPAVSYSVSINIIYKLANRNNCLTNNLLAVKGRGCNLQTCKLPTRRDLLHHTAAGRFVFCLVKQMFLHSNTIQQWFACSCEHLFAPSRGGTNSCLHKNHCQKDNGGNLPCNGLGTKSVAIKFSYCSNMMRMSSSVVHLTLLHH